MFWMWISIGLAMIGFVGMCAVHGTAYFYDQGYSDAKCGRPRATRELRKEQ